MKRRAVPCKCTLYCPDSSGKSRRSLSPIPIMYPLERNVMSPPASMTPTTGSALLEDPAPSSRDAFTEPSMSVPSTMFPGRRGKSDALNLLAFSPSANTIRIFTYKIVVNEVEDEDKEISLEEARKVKPIYNLGDHFIEEELSPKLFTRIAAQNAKQIITQRLTDEHKKLVLDEMNEKEGEIVTATIRRVENNNVYVEISGSQMEGIMMPSDQIRGEKYSVNDIIKVYVKSVRTSTKGNSQVIVSRGCVGFVKRLFEMEVPEVRSGLVVIKKIVREAGYRTKLAVTSDDPSLDSVGSCIGQRGMRINSIVHELDGEKIDVIEWCADPSEFIARALSPAKAMMVQINEEEKRATAIVPDEKLSLAIGKAGQNVRLAAKLTEWKIDVKPFSEMSNIVGDVFN